MIDLIVEMKDEPVVTLKDLLGDLDIIGFVWIPQIPTLQIVEKEDSVKKDNIRR